MIAAIPSSLLAAIPVALAAGFISFASPCVLPLVPGYLAFLSGEVGLIDTPTQRGRAVTGALCFTLGFSVVFILEGALFGELGAHLHADSRPWAIGLGALTIAMGLFFAGWLPIKSLQRDRRIHRLPPATLLGAVGLGFLFSLGWTPCLGPTLQAILNLAAQSAHATALKGSILALFYCLGLGVPFMVVALASEWAARTLGVLKRHRRAVSTIGGVMLIAIGVLEVSGLWAHLVTWLQVHFPSSRLPL